MAAGCSGGRFSYAFCVPWWPLAFWPELRGATPEPAGGRRRTNTNKPHIRTLDFIACSFPSGLRDAHNPDKILLVIPTFELPGRSRSLQSNADSLAVLYGNTSHRTPAITLATVGTMASPDFATDAGPAELFTGGEWFALGGWVRHRPAVYAGVDSLGDRLNYLRGESIFSRGPKRLDVRQHQGRPVQSVLPVLR